MSMTSHFGFKPSGGGRAGSARGSGRTLSRARLRVALLADYMDIFSDGYEERIRQAFDQECRRLGLDLLLVYGRSLDPLDPEQSSHNAVFDQIGPNSVDAVIVLSGALSANCGAAGIAGFLERYRDVPLCSVGAEVPEVPSVLVDGTRGMRAMVEHLASTHGCSRLGFIAGPSSVVEAVERLTAYRAVLAERGIPFDPARVVSGHFTRSGGAAAAEELLSRGVALDGIVAANDSMALGALDVLRRRADGRAALLPVTGFDDFGEARWENPPLSTVAQPFADIATSSIDAVLRRIDGRDAPLVTVLMPRLLIRQSCQCGMDGVRASRSGVGLALAVPSTTSSGGQAQRAPVQPRDARELRERLGVLIHSALDPACSDASLKADQLADGLCRELSGEEGAVCRVLAAQLRGCDAYFAQVVQHLLSRLRSELGGASTPALEDLWHRARDMAAAATSASFAQARLELHFLHVRLLALSERLSASADLDSLREVLVECLPRLGIETAFLSRFVGSDHSELLPLMCLLDGERWDLCRRAYPACELMPPGGFAVSRRRSFVVFPLVHDSQALGFVGFEFFPDAVGHRLIREHVAASLRIALLSQTVTERTLLHDMSIQDTLAAARRLQSLNALTGNVAHDLNNALGPMLALPDAILADIEGLPLDADRVAELRADATAIKRGALRAAQTVKDLLSLGRQTRGSRRSIDVRSLVRSWCEHGADGGRAGSLSSVGVALELGPDPLTIRAAEPQLGRAVCNLLRRATQESPDGSFVEVRVSAASLLAPLDGHERVEPGEYAVIAITDRGPGIPDEELVDLFQPYFSRGSAVAEDGMGLGLAMVQAVVKDHGGYIDVVTKVGSGTTFRLYLPRSGELPSVDKPSAPRAKVSVRLLVVDDEPMQLRTARRILGLLGYQVELLNSGKKAVELFERAAVTGASPYALVLMDMMLNEERDGLEVLESIRRLFPEQRAILLSGHVQAEWVRGERETPRGMVWLAKPYTMDALSHAVASALCEDDSRVP